MESPSQNSSDVCRGSYHHAGLQGEGILPCCRKCPICDKRIKIKAYEAHIEQCLKAKAMAGEELKKELEKKLQVLLNEQPHTE